MISLPCSLRGKAVFQPLVTVLLAAPLLCQTSFAESDSPVFSSKAPLDDVITPADDSSFYDRLWGSTKLYHADSGFLTDFRLQGRMHLQHADGNSNAGHFDSGFRPDDVTWGDIEVRRWRLGFKSEWLDGKVRLDGQIDIGPTWNGFYSQLFDAKVGFDLSENIDVSIGKHRIDNFGHEFHGSSNQLLTLERSLLSNALSGAVLTGVDIDGGFGNWIWSLAAFAGDNQREFTQFEGGTIFQGAFGYDYAEAVGYDSGVVRLDYQANTDGVNERGAFAHAFSLNNNLEKGRYSVFTDILGGVGRGTQGDVWGISVAPAYYLVDDKLQFVLRYQYARGEDDGLRLQSRYERLAPNLTDGGRGEHYNAAYAGFNYFLYGHKLKFMSGMEYHNMDGGGDGGDFDGWTWSTAFRMYF